MEPEPARAWGGRRPLIQLSERGVDAFDGADRDLDRAAPLVVLAQEIMDRNRNEGRWLLPSHLPQQFGEPPGIVVAELDFSLIRELQHDHAGKLTMAWPLCRAAHVRNCNGVEVIHSQRVQGASLTYD
jgi:hypothetical protein